MMPKERNVGTILSFVLGAAAGAVTALLFAPKSGAELRSDVAEGVDDGINQVRSTGKDLKHRAQKVVNSAKARVEDAVGAGQEAYDHAKNS
jgi:gas vesicle protein